MVTVGNVCRRRGFSPPFWVYHRLPRSLLSERIALAILVWSGPGLPTVTTTLRVPDDPFWLVWISLPILTMPPFWVHTYRGNALPTFTTAAKGLHIDRSVVASIGHQGTGWAGWHRVITVDNGGEPRGTIRSGGTVAGRHRKENF
jgi:hypothetical protein